MIKVDFYDEELTLQEEVYSFVSVLAVNTYNTMGSFLLELINSPELSNTAKLWQYCVVNDDTNNVFVVTNVNITDTRIIISGFPATFILGKRVSLDVIKKVNAEQAMLNLVNKMNYWEKLSSNTPKGYSDVFKNQISDMSVLEYEQGIGQAVDMGFRVAKRDNLLRFECYKPSINENAKYSTSLRNVTNVQYVANEDEYANVAIVAGEGEGENRTVVIVTIGDPQGRERRELYVDARSEQPEEDETEEEYRQRLERIGLQALAECPKIESLFFDVSTDDTVKLGDIVTVSIDEYNIVMQVRVVEDQILSVNNTITRKIGVGTPLKVRNII